MQIRLNFQDQKFGLRTKFDLLSSHPQHYDMYS